MKKILFCTHKQSPFYQTIPQALRNLGYSVDLFDYYQPTLQIRLRGLVNNLVKKQSANEEINTLIATTLLKRIKKNQPNYFLTTKALNLTSETIKKINSFGVITINWFQDLLEFMPWLIENASAYKFIFTPDPFMQRELKKNHIRSHYLPLAANPDQVIKEVPKEYDVIFTGQFTKRREKIFSELSKLADKFVIFGYPKWKTSLLANHYHGLLPSITNVYATLRKSKIVVNVQTAEVEYPTEVVNLRVFETTGVGAFLLNYYHPSIDKFFNDGEEIVNFKNPQDLFSKASYYLSHAQERKHIALAGWKRTVRDHTYQKRLKQMFSVIHRGL